jgi:hypothetical protein
MPAQGALAPVDSKPQPLTEVEARGRVERLLPERRGRLRRIAFLWGTHDALFFRVNFHDPDADNRIAESFFVEAGRETAKVRP